MLIPGLKNYLIAILGAACLALGAWGYTQSEQLSALERAVEIDEQNRRAVAEETQRIARKNLERLNDQIIALSAARLSEQRSSAARLRELAETARASSVAAAACSRLDVPAVAVIPDSTRERLERIADEADAVADSLRACQGYVREVVQPAE